MEVIRLADSLFLFLLPSPPVSSVYFLDIPSMCVRDFRAVCVRVDGMDLTLGTRELSFPSSEWDVMGCGDELYNV